MSDRWAILERIVVAIASTIIAASVLGLWYGVADISRNQAVIKSQLADVRAVGAGVYLRRDAEEKHEEIFRTNQHQYSLLEDHEQRLRKIEARKR